MIINVLDPNNLPPKGKLSPAALDLTGLKINNFTVQYYAYSKNWMPYWVCLCDCGNYFICSRQNITRKDKKQQRSCGCYSKEIASKTHRKNLLGQKFGFLEVVEDTKQSSKDGHALWKCKCLCGNYTIVNSCNLQSGSISSCGCLGRSSGEAIIEKYLKEKNISFEREYKFEDLKGNKFNLRFDFAIFDSSKNLSFLLEFQGIQHFTNAFNKKQEEFEMDLKRDLLKKEYCKNNNIPLYEITYVENIEKKLEEILKESLNEETR